MTVDLKNEATDVEDANRGKPGLSRRSFLVGLTAVGIGSATAISLSINAVNAAPETEIASSAKDLTNSETLPESKRAEVVQETDPNDPLNTSISLITVTVGGWAAGCTGGVAGRTAGSDAAGTTTDEAEEAGRRQKDSALTE